MRRFLSMLLVLATLLTPGAVPLARARQAAPSGREAARDHFRRGEALQQQGAYAEAIREYEAGHALVALPEFLFNIAQCYRLMRRAPEAVAYYRRYLDEAPQGLGAVEARAHIEALERPPPIDARPEAGAPAPAPPAGQPPPAPDTRPAVPPAATRPAAGLEPDARPVPEARPRFGVWQITSLSLLSLGAVGAGLGTYHGVRAHRLASEVSIPDGGMWTDELERKAAEGERAGRLSVQLFVGAGVLVAAGAATWWLADGATGKSRSPARTAWRLAPWGGAGTTGVVLGGSF